MIVNITLCPDLEKHGPCCQFTNLVINSLNCVQGSDYFRYRHLLPLLIRAENLPLAGREGENPPPWLIPYRYWNSGIERTFEYFSLPRNWNLLPVLTSHEHRPGLPQNCSHHIAPLFFLDHIRPHPAHRNTDWSTELNKGYQLWQLDSKREKPTQYPNNTDVRTLPSLPHKENNMPLRILVMHYTR